MRIVAILVLPAIVAAAPAPDQVPVKRVCQDEGMQKVDRTAASNRPHRLTAEPPGKQVLTIVRTVDGCSRPVIVREEVGAPRR